MAKVKVKKVVAVGTEADSVPSANLAGVKNVKKVKKVVAVGTEADSAPSAHEIAVSKVESLCSSFSECLEKEKGLAASLEATKTTKGEILLQLAKATAEAFSVREAAKTFLESKTLFSPFELARLLKVGWTNSGGKDSTGKTLWSKNTPEKVATFRNASDLAGVKNKKAPKAPAIPPSGMEPIVVIGGGDAIANALAVLESAFGNYKKVAGLEQAKAWVTIAFAQCGGKA